MSFGTSVALAAYDLALQRKGSWESVDVWANACERSCYFFVSMKHTTISVGWVLIVIHIITRYL